MRKSLVLLTTLAILSCAAPPPPAPPPRTAVAPAPKVEAPVVVDGPRAELIKKLDEMVQWRFSKITDDDVRTRRFGMNRMGPTKDFHIETLNISAAVNGLGSEGWTAGLYAARVSLGTTSRFRGPVALGGGEWTAIEDRRAVEELARHAMTSRSPVVGVSHGVPLEARIVPVSAPVCQRCHQGKEIGDPAGVVVYAFHRERPSVATPGHDSGR